MRNILLLVVGCLFIQAAQAAEYPKLRMKISGDTSDKQLF